MIVERWDKLADLPRIDGAAVAKLETALALGASGRNPLSVRVRPAAPLVRGMLALGAPSTIIKK